MMGNALRDGLSMGWMFDKIEDWCGTFSASLLSEGFDASPNSATEKARHGLDSGNEHLEREQRHHSIIIHPHY